MFVHFILLHHTKLNAIAKFCDPYAAFLDVSRNLFVGTMNQTCDNYFAQVEALESAFVSAILSDCWDEVICECCSDCFDSSGVSINKFCEQNSVDQCDRDFALHQSTTQILETLTENVDEGLAAISRFMEAASSSGQE